MSKVRKTKALRKIEKLFDKNYNNRPNIYKFLTDRGVSDEIADDAQYIISNHFLGPSAEIEKIIFQEVETLLKKVERLKTKIEKLGSDLEW